MWSTKFLVALEELALLIGRLDSRISATPLAEAWQVRACLQAAEALAAVDGTITRSGDIVGMMLEAPLPSTDAYAPANIGLAHWRRCMANVSMSELGARIIGRTASPSVKAAEDQADWDLEDTLPAGVEVGDGKSILDDIDSFARDVSSRALGIMRAQQGNGPALIGLAAAVQQAVRLDPDADYFDRVDRLRREFAACATSEAERRKAALPSPTDERQADAVASQKRHIDEWRQSFLDGEIWQKPRHLGSCYAVIPDRLQELGITANRLSCLTGATKRLGFDARLDDQGLLGFLRQMASEARAGLALLDGLERAMAVLATSSATKFDPRSAFPDVLYAFLLLPAVDPGWLELALEIDKRVVQKLMKRLVDADLVSHWTDKRRSDLDGSQGREAKLWVIAGFEKAYDLSLRRVARPGKPNSLPIDPAVMLARHRDIDVSIPMAQVYHQYDSELIDIDKQFGAFFDRNWWKNRPPRKAVEAKNRASGTVETPRGIEALYGA